MGIYFNKLHRRAILKQLGIALALPTLESLVPYRDRKAYAATSFTPNKNFVSCFFPLGAHQQNHDLRNQGRPSVVDKNYWDYPYLLKNFQTKFAGEALTIRGSKLNGWAHGGSASFLTGHHIDMATYQAGKYGKMGISVDQMIAQQKKASSILGGVVLGWENGQARGPARYHDTISWLNANQPVGTIQSPKQLFDFLFKRNHNFNNLSIKEEQALIHRQKSILDAVIQDIAKVKTKLSANDKQTLDRYLAQVRQMEQEVSDPPKEPVCNKPSAPASDSKDMLTFWKQMNAITAAGFQCGLIHTATMTYSASVMFGVKSRRRLANVTAKGSPRTTGFHDLGHRSTMEFIGNYDRKSLVKAHLKFTAEYLSLFEDLADKFKSNGLMHNSTLLTGSGCTDGSHSVTNIPLLLLTGNPAVKKDFIGAFRTLNHHNHLLADLLALHGINVSSFGPASSPGLRNKWGLFV